MFTASAIADQATMLAADEIAQQFRRCYLPPGQEFRQLLGVGTREQD